jgi:hypothetical protein
MIYNVRQVDYLLDFIICAAVRKANFIYADQRSYTGDFSDSLRHGKGTMIWPNHSQYIVS